MKHKEEIRVLCLGANKYFKLFRNNVRQIAELVQKQTGSRHADAEELEGELYVYENNGDISGLTVEEIEQYFQI